MIYRKWRDDLLNQGKITKLNHKPNFTLHARIVNERVTHDCRPLLPFITTDGGFPNIQSCWPIVAWAAQQAYLAKIDLTKAFHSIPLASDQVGAYAFQIDGQYYAYTTMPMGATNAPKHFHADDIFISATNSKQLRQRYQKAIDYLIKCNFQVNKLKSQLNCTDLLGYTLNNHQLSIPEQKWKRIEELLNSNNLDLIKRAAQTLSYYKHTLSESQQFTIRKLLTNKVKDSDILTVYTKALAVKPKKTFSASAGEPLKLYLDSSNTAAGLVLKQADNILLTASIPLPAVHNYANSR
ncbi:putative Pol protein [Gregarina niphandrodes]|uniref:Pol protein n=1 Tax=Gregarina niphandrodes TaxID=110365 RepID=A0A023B8A1_GRENI|nr:putative Pol protein [Gregarina niphandrodes]EZG68851.1 putative Pol protein [Gregarina niphandrodes]|eukprot:XP_011134545.1 putative Pol protein [Gregarina niphandrodes]